MSNLLHFQPNKYPAGGGGEPAPVEPFGTLLFLSNDWDDFEGELPEGVSTTMFGTGPSLSTAQTKIGTNSLLYSTTGGIQIDGSDTLASVANENDFTFEGFIYQTSHATHQTLFSKRDASSAEEFVVYITTDGLLEFATLRAGSVNEHIFSDAALTLNQWLHVAFVRKDRELMMFVDGVKQIDTATETLNPSSNSGDFTIGFDRSSTSRPFVGYIGPVRILMEAALYDADFTPQTTAFEAPTVEEAATPHRYWRVLCTAALNSTYYSIANLEMRESVGGADVTTEGAYIQGSQFSTYVGSDAFDADETDTYWLTAKSNGDDAWVGQDFGDGNEKNIVEVEIGARSHATNFNQTPSDFIVQWSDDSTNWHNAHEVTGATWASAEQEAYEIPAAETPVEATRWRMYTRNRPSNGYVWIEELNL